jgi:hypothetical protein
MAAPTIRSTVEFNDCWPVHADWAMNPVRSVTVQIDGAEGEKTGKRLRNLRPTGAAMVRLLGGPSDAAATPRQRELAATLRDADGHGGHFSPGVDAKWRSAYWDNQVYPGDSREDVIRKHAAREIGRRESMARFAAEVGDVNALARLETGLYVAFRHPESSHPRILALARFAGVELDDNEHDISMVPLVLGKSALMGGGAVEPMSLPAPHDTAWPFVEVS